MVKLIFQLLRKSHPQATDEWDREWTDYELHLQFNKTFNLSTKNGRTIPLNEVEGLLLEMNKLAQGKTFELEFEPMEPDFQILVKSIFDDAEVPSYMFQTWIDKDNIDATGYGLAAIGVRFFVSKEELETFIREVGAEVAQLKKQA